MAYFLLELRSEEIPARMQAGARNDLARLFAEELDELGVSAEAIDVWSTPRRLALIARGLPLETQAVSEEIMGPRTNAPASCDTSSAPSGAADIVVEKTYVAIPFIDPALPLATATS